MSDDSGGGDPNVTEEQLPTLPPVMFNTSVPHYYGDYVRQIFMVVGALMLILAPLIVNRAPELLPFEIGGAIILVVLAALTSPKKLWVLVADALAAGAGVILFESIALAAYAAGNWFAFAILEVITIAFLFALYFSLKTVRAMSLGQVGRKPHFGEFTSS